jgi:hypothetical protein
MDVESFWRSCSPEQRSQLLQVPLAPLLEGERNLLFRVDVYGIALQVLCRCLVNLNGRTVHELGSVAYSAAVLRRDCSPAVVALDVALYEYACASSTSVAGSGSPPITHTQLLTTAAHIVRMSH